MRLIDRQAALAEIDDAIARSLQRPEDVYINKGLTMARTLIEKLPTIEAEPVRHGRWEFRDEDKKLIEDGCIPYNMWCSECGEWADSDSYGNAYCHNCGAKMDLRTPTEVQLDEADSVMMGDTDDGDCNKM